MSGENITPDPAENHETVDVTVGVPAHRVEQFRRFHAHFLELSARWDARVGNEDLFRRGRRGRGRHGGRCGEHGHGHGPGRHGRPEWAGESPAAPQEPEVA